MLIIPPFVLLDQGVGSDAVADIRWVCGYIRTVGPHSAGNPQQTPAGDHRAGRELWKVGQHLTAFILSCITTVKNRTSFISLSITTLLKIIKIEKKKTFYQYLE